MGHETKHCLILSSLFDQRFTSTERGARILEESKNGRLCLRQMCLAICLLLAPACSGDKQQLCIGTDGLCFAARDANSRVCRMYRTRVQRDLDQLHVRLSCRAAPWLMTTRIHDQKPWPSFALNRRFQPLSIEPALHSNGTIHEIDRDNVRIHFSL